MRAVECRGARVGILAVETLNVLVALPQQLKRKNALGCGYANVVGAAGCDTGEQSVEGLGDGRVAIEAPNHRTAGSQRTIGLQKL